MWSIGVYDYGLTSEQFWRLTPWQFKALGKRHDVAREQTDFGFANVASVIAECNRNLKSRKKPFTHKDFMPVYELPKAKSTTELKSYWDLMVRPHNEKAEKARAKRRRVIHGESIS